MPPVRPEPLWKRALPPLARRASAIGLHGSLAMVPEAGGRLDEAIRLDPDFGKLHGRAGVLYQTLGRLEDAEAAYRRAEDLGPPRRGPHYNLGTVLEAKGRPAESIDLQGEAIRDRPRRRRCSEQRDGCWPPRGSAPRRSAPASRSLS